MSKPTVVITGVSTGIGRAAAKLFTSQDITVFGSVRTVGDADRLLKECGPNFHALIFDITDEEKVKHAAQFVREQLQGKKLWGLINNAGMVVQGALLNIPIKEFQKQLDVNLLGQLIVTQAFLPFLGTDDSLAGPPGKIINISSEAGKRTFPFLGPYSTSKHALEGLSEGLRRELMIFGIDVIIVGPGAIQTDIWDKAKKQPLPPDLQQSVYYQSATAFKKYMLEVAAKTAMPAEDVAKLLLKILRAKHPKVRYAPIPHKFLNWTLPNLLPKRWLDWIIAKQFNMLKK